CVDLDPRVNVLLGNNSAGKSTILRCLALSAIGTVAANEVEDRASSYLRKGGSRGAIEVLFEIIPDPESGPGESGYLATGLQIASGSSRFTPLPDPEMTLRRPGDSAGPLRNSADLLGTLRSDLARPFGFVAGYGPMRFFSDSRYSVSTELKKRENEWV